MNTDKPRIIFIDLHCNDFLVRHYARIRANNQVKSFKHQFLISYLESRGYEICNLITDAGTKRGGRLMKLPLAKCVEACYVERKNGLRHHKVLSLSDIKDDDIVCAYLVYNYQLEILSNISCYKVLFGNHFVRINEPIDIKTKGINAFVNEIDLHGNKFVSQNLRIEGVDSVLVPYSYQKRFTNIKPFEERENKVMAVGTSSTCSIEPDKYKLYREYFNTELIQPMRQEIYEKQEELKDWIDCYISSILEDGGKQSKYTSFDMVETFNKYKVFVCPEELVGMPGIGFVEGMACGTAYIGLYHDMYKCLGLIPGYHYITYDGSLEDLKKVFYSYINRPEELRQIAERGTKFVREHFNNDKIANEFEKQLMYSYDKYIRNAKTNKY